MFQTTAGIVIETKELWEELQASLVDSPVQIVFEQPQLLDWAAFGDKLQRLQPHLLFLDVSGVKDVGETIRRIRALPPNPTVYVLNTKAEATEVLEAIRAGAAEYFLPPFGPALHAALERFAAERQSRAQPLRPTSKILGFFSAKGGCGATTIACHTALELPHQTKSKVLLADLDLDAGLVSFLLKTKSPYSLMDAAQNLHRLDASYWKALVANGIPNVETITAPPSSAHIPMPEQIEKVFQFVRSQYDWVVLDLGRGLNPMILSCLQNCDQIYLVTTAELPALHQTQQTVIRLVGGGLAEKVRVVLNRPPKRMDVSLSELEKMLGAPVYFVFPDDYANLNESFVEGKLAAPNSALGRSFTAFTRKLAEVAEPRQKKRFSLF